MIQKFWIKMEWKCENCLLPMLLSGVYFLLENYIFISILYILLHCILHFTCSFFFILVTIIRILRLFSTLYWTLCTSGIMVEFLVRGNCLTFFEFLALHFKRHLAERHLLSLKHISYNTTLNLYVQLYTYFNLSFFVYYINVADFSHHFYVSII